MTTNTPSSGTPAYQAEITWERRRYRAFALRLIRSVRDVHRLPERGRNLIVVAELAGVLHFRIFDRDCEVVADTDEKRLAGTARAIEDFRMKLEPLWPPHALEQSETEWVIDAVKSIVGEVSLPKRQSPAQGDTAAPPAKGPLRTVGSGLQFFVEIRKPGGKPIRFRVNHRCDRSLSFTDYREQSTGSAGTRGIWGTLPEKPAGKPRNLTPTGFQSEVARLIGAERAAQIVEELTI